MSDFQPEPEAAAAARATIALAVEALPGTVDASAGGKSKKPNKKRKTRQQTAKSQRLTREELRERLRLSSCGLIEEIHSLALRQNQSEDQRETRLDGKAASLLATAGLSATVAFALGNMLTSQSSFLSPLGTAARVVPILYVLALAFGLLSTVWALRALKVRADYKTLSDEDVFNEGELERIQRVAGSDDKKAQAEFRRYITIQHWSFYRAHGDIHDKKADVIRNGQRFFAAFVCTLLIIGAGIAYSAFRSLDNHSAAAACAKGTP